MATPIESIINTPLIVSVGESVRLLCLCLDPMSISSVLALFCSVVLMLGILILMLFVEQDV